MGIAIESIERLAATTYGTDEKWISEACLLENEIDPSDLKGNSPTKAALAWRAGRGKHLTRSAGPLGGVR